MIVKETYGTWIDGTPLIRTYSDLGYYIERDGIKYDEAVDPEKFHREYVETDEPIVVDTKHND